jgi:proteasome lid subunit RPN8/RPN11
MIRQLTLRKEHWHEMLQYVDAQVPLEAGGLLAGTDNQVERVIRVRNQAQSPVRFVMDPHEQLKAFDWIESRGMDLLGIFHSHPAGPETVSVTDIAEAAYPVVHVIWSPRGDRWQARAFWIEDGQPSEVGLQIIE